MKLHFLLNIPKNYFNVLLAPTKKGNMSCDMFDVQSSDTVITVETQYNEILGTRIFFFLYQIFGYICQYLVKKQYKTKQINSLGPEKTVCYIRYL